jgi:hypothetical protein
VGFQLGALLIGINPMGEQARTGEVDDHPCTRCVETSIRSSSQMSGAGSGFSCPHAVDVDRRGERVVVKKLVVNLTREAAPSVLPISWSTVGMPAYSPRSRKDGQRHVAPRRRRRIGTIISESSLAELDVPCR